MTAARRRVEWDWAGPHGTVWGTGNAAFAAFAAAMVAFVSGLPWWWALIGAAVGAVVKSIDDGRREDTDGVRVGVPAGTRRYRLACWAGAGGWTAVAVVSGPPWSARNLLILAGLAMAAGTLAPAFAQLERRLHDEQRLRRIGAQRTVKAETWEGRIARVCGVKGCRVSGVEDWPEGAGYTLDVDLPAGGSTWRDLASSADALAADAKLPNGCGVEIGPGVDRRAALVRVSTVDMLAVDRVLPADWSARTVLNPVAVGWHRDGTVAAAPIREEAWMVVGQRGSGKTTQLNSVISQLVRCTDAMVWVIDLNGGALGVPWALPWWEGRADRPAVDWVAGTGEEAWLMTEAALAIALDRKRTAQAIKRRENVTLMPVSPEMPEIVIVVDEAAEVIGERSRFPLVRRNLEELLRIARDAAVNEIYGVLRATEEYIDPGMKAQLDVRAALALASDAEVAYALGWEAKLRPEDIPYKGCGALVTSVRLAQARPYKAPNMLPAQVAECAAAVAPLRPGIEASALAAVEARIGAGKYDRRWERASVLFDKELVMAGRVVGMEGDGEQGAEAEEPGELWQSSGTAEDAIRRADEAVRNLRREAAIAEGRDPDLEEAFLRVVGDPPPQVDMSDPANWPEPNLPPVEADLPGAEKAGARDRAMEILAAAGQQGLTPQQITERLRAEGYTTVRQTVHGWLTEAVETGEVIAGGRRGVYVTRPGG